MINKIFKIILLFIILFTHNSENILSWMDPYKTYDRSYPRFKREDVEQEESNWYVGAGIIGPLYNKLNNYAESFNYNNSELISSEQNDLELTSSAGFSLTTGKYNIGSKLRFDFELSYTPALSENLLNVSSLYDYSGNSSAIVLQEVDGYSAVSSKFYSFLLNAYFHTKSQKNYSFFINPSAGLSFLDLELGSTSSIVNINKTGSASLDNSYDQSSTLVMPIFGFGVGFLYSINKAVAFQGRLRYISTLAPIGSLDSFSIAPLTETESSIDGGMRNIALIDLSVFFK